MLKLVLSNCDPDEYNIMKLEDYFYWQEHLVIVTELLGDNLYEFDMNYRKRSGDSYFTSKRLKDIARQILTSLKKLHSINILHCDIKPENVLIKNEHNNSVRFSFLIKFR